jgi:hypothetical protein
MSVEHRIASRAHTRAGGARSVTIEVFDLPGRRLIHPHDGRLAAGTHRFSVPVRLAPGTYIVRASGDGTDASARLVRTR